MMCIAGNWLKTEQRQNLLLSDVQAGTIHHTHVHCFQRQIKPLVSLQEAGSYLWEPSIYKVPER